MTMLLMREISRLGGEWKFAVHRIVWRVGGSKLPFGSPRWESGSGQECAFESGNLMMRAWFGDVCGKLAAPVAAYCWV